MVDTLADWLAAFLFTQAVECPLYVAALVRHRSEPTSFRRALPLAFLASTMTHPVVWFVIPTAAVHWAPGLDYWDTVILCELFAVGAEAAYLAWLGVRHAWLWSLAANLASAGLGLTSRHLFGWP